MEPIKNRDHQLISAWLLIGVVMVFFQIMLGGITRLTGSGLSITRWDIVTGVIPPLNDKDWQISFDLYKATPQYQHINQGMSIAEFKFIFFWEYVHRLWARSMGLIFLGPFLFFLFRKSLNKQLLKRLFYVVMIAALAGAFGWIMVASGLIDRPWVNAYKLTVHLALGILLFITLFLTWLHHRGFQKNLMNSSWNRAVLILLVLTCIQIIFGGFVSGMKSAMSYPSWPLMNEEWVPSILLEKSHWNIAGFLLYDKAGFMPALAQFVHRNIAYLIFIYSLIISIGWFKSTGTKWHWISITLLGIIVVQISLGILTLLHSIGSIPVLFGSLHQGIGILFLTFLVFLYLTIKPVNIK
jgi:cytochrome c oxidase assembly protein subunit 15